VDLVLATHNVGRRGTGVCRLGGHQEGYARPPYPGKRPIYIDQEIIKGNGKMLTVWACNAFQSNQEIIKGNGKMLTVWACNAFQSTLNAQEYRQTLYRRANIVRDALAQVRGGDIEDMVNAVFDAVTNRGGLFVVSWILQV